ncbi:hypothetical protein KUTeg_015952 [Tegillarca granosa]|uniref:Uncharacterized protein n=1 Tax=Tegillarca granosa TaxID=220873 RepID=A0ABQ9EJF2_TEGGR|nr:hypothetical protein KUTeg_015952 [Tegillarca granosa]
MVVSCYCQRGQTSWFVSVHKYLCERTRNMKRTNGNAPGQDIMMNLLGDSTDSDPELLNLPPLKGKKPKKKRTYGGPSESSLCSMWTCMKITLFLVLIGGVCILGFITFWLAGQVGELQAKLDKGN